MKGEFFMLKHIDLQLFAEEGSGVNEPVAAEQENTAEETSEVMTQEQPQTGVEQQPAAGENEGVEKAFAARLAKERARLEAELRRQFEVELKNNPYLSYLEQKAQRLGVTVDQLIENDRKWEEQQALNELIQKNIPDEYAKEILENRKFREQYQEEKAEREKQEKEHQMMAEFLDAYPDVKPEDIPVEVWVEVNKGRNLLDAYVSYENKRLKEEMAKFQQQQQVQQANEKNAASSTGSAKSSGATGGYISREQFEANKHDINWVRKNLSILEESRKHW
jgi:hypothetical protein